MLFASLLPSARARKTVALGLVWAAWAGGMPEAGLPARHLLDSVVVSPRTLGAAEGAIASTHTLDFPRFQTLPNAGDDLFRGLARLPGLAADDISAQFWVRGAPHSEVRTRLDGVDLIEPFHLKDAQGALAIVDPGVIAWLELATGGFPADHGDRLAGVLTLETRGEPGRRTALSLSLTGAGTTAQGGLPARRGRWLVTARRGFPELALRASGQEQHAFPAYHDALAKVELDLAPGEILSAHVLTADDRLRYTHPDSPALTSRYGSTYAWLRWRRGLATSRRSETVVSWSRLSWSRHGEGRSNGFPFSLRDERGLRTLTARTESAWPAGEHLQLRAGAEGSLGHADYAYALQRQQVRVVGGRLIAIPGDVTARLAPERRTAGAFTAARLGLGAGIAVEPSLRFDRLRPGEPGTWNPRLNAAWVQRGFVVRAAWGRYAQAQGLHELAVADGETTFGRADLAEHRVVSVERPLGAGLHARLEAYSRDSLRIRPRWENLENAYDIFPEAQLDRFRVAPSAGSARGLELMLRGRSSRWNWNASYSLAKAEDRVEGRWLPRSRDQRHAVSADATFVPARDWQLSAAWSFHSGWPTTGTSYRLESLTEGRQVAVPIVGPAYALRLPDYHRLDLRLARRFAGPWGEWRVHLDLFNAYGRRNLSLWFPVSGLIPQPSFSSLSASHCLIML
ncbi:MAG: hypothetical protein RL479_1999, partial [Verrucomicrobiota bacterium]